MSNALNTATSILGSEQSLDLSESRAHDCALDILQAYKLSDNFPINLQIVLTDLGAFADVAFVIEPKSIQCRLETLLS